jgi:hypothetical protein
MTSEVPCAHVCRKVPGVSGGRPAARTRALCPRMRAQAATSLRSASPLVLAPNKIRMYLKRYHDVEISSSGVWRILRKLDMNRLPSSQRYKRLDKRYVRYEKQQPGHRVQVDVKFVKPPKGSRTKYYQFTAIDDCTTPRVLKIYDRLNQRTAIQFVDYVLVCPSRSSVIQPDNGAEFQTSFHWHVLDKGIGHVYIKPRRPGSTARVERQRLGFVPARLPIH